MAWRWLGRVSYEAGVAAQREQRDRLLAGDASAACLLLCEHEAVITLGRAADPSHVLVGDAFVGALAAVGIGVTAAAAPVLYVDTDFFAELSVT